MKPDLFPLTPGERIDGDWFDRPVPDNISVGENVLIDSAHAFYFFKTKAPDGMTCGDNVTFWRTSLAVGEKAILKIGSNCQFANASLVCDAGISIGDNVMVGLGATIADSDFHPTNTEARIADTIALSPEGDRANRPDIRARPVTIEDDVWIGPKAAILKGVKVGKGAVIAPGAVVVSHVPAGAHVAGNPAKVVRDEP